MTNLAPELSIVLDRTAAEPLYHQYYAALRALIVDGALARGARLPSVRKATAAFGISKPTVERAYQQLLVEGYVDVAPRSGFTVRALDTAFLRRHADPTARDHVPDPPERTAFFRGFAPDARLPHDFAYARLQPGSFPARDWARLTAEALSGPSCDALCGYADETEPDLLQRELAAWLRRTRGVACAPERVLVMPSTEAALDALLQLLDPQGGPIGVEEPGYLVPVHVARRQRFALRPLRVENGPDAFLGDVRASGAQAVFVTPSHQFPTGAVMAMDTRVELLKWADAAGAYVIEDDACNEYRYATDAVPSLRSLDADERVAYLGNFSKTLAPGLRIAYLVLPEPLHRRWLERFRFTMCGVSAVERQVLGRFVADGLLDRQVRRMVAGNRRRHDALLDGLRAGFGERMRIDGADAGMHFYVTVRNGMGSAQLVWAAAGHGARVYPADPFWFACDAPPARLLLGFAALREDCIDEAVRALVRAWT